MPGSGMGSPASDRCSGRSGSGTARMRSMASAVSDWSNSLDSPGSVAIFASVDAVEKSMPRISHAEFPLRVEDGPVLDLLMPVEDAPDGACESVVVQEGQFRPLAYVDHDGFLSDGPIPSSSRSHAPGFFAADIFFEDEKPISVGMRVEGTHHSISGRN